MKFDTINKAKVLLLLCLTTFLALPLFTSPAIAGNDDSDLNEVGVEWVENYHGVYGMNNLTWTSEEAEGFYNRLGEIGWTKKFDFGDDLAWEADFEKPAVNGWDYLYADNVDFAYFAGHGTPDAFWFGTKHDWDGTYLYCVHYSEAEWGDQDLEWIVISACNVLNDEYSDVFSRWGWPVFKGLHAIFGLATICYDQPIWILYPFWWESPGARFVDYMTTVYITDPFVIMYSIGESWRRTTIDWQPSDVYGAALAVYDPSTDYRGWDDYLPGYGYVGPDIDNPTSLIYMRWQC
jgi:hypothetical protein